jgi:hypothetical protein
MANPLLRYCCIPFLTAVVVCDQSICMAQEPIAEAVPNLPAREATQEQDDVLMLIKLSESDLPKSVRLVEPLRTAPILPVTRNPDVLVDKQRILPVAIFFGVSDKSELKSVRFGVVAIYQDNKPANEIGVYGLFFNDEAAAKERFKKLAKDNQDSPYILKDRLLLYVWKEVGVSKEAYQTVHDHLRVAKFKDWSTVNMLTGFIVHDHDYSLIEKAHLKRHPLHESYTPENKVKPLTRAEKITYGKLNQKLHDALREISKAHFRETPVPDSLKEDREPYYTHFTYQNSDWYGPSYECYIVVIADYISADLLKKFQGLLVDDFRDWCIQVVVSESYDFGDGDAIVIFSDQVLVPISAANILGIPTK